MNLLVNGWNPENKGERYRFFRIIQLLRFGLRAKKKTEQVHVRSDMAVSSRAGRTASALFELQVKGKGGASNDSGET
ncbi:hypothetical protein [Paenibacillus glycanilyticus]|uniref:hypothetical protein n=1 Tax=Paenibacillus glycanilyticus TaxID=126569 RepID=UPI00191055ED|nr:hypothetical protein [Paenibacillus glycanilyticus]